MAVFRVEKNRDYTVMANIHLRDRNLSLKAKGLLSMMLSLPEKWIYSEKGLASISKEGVKAISTTVRELEAAGYVERIQTRKVQGLFGPTEYLIRERPVLHNRSADNGETDERSADNSTLINKEIKNTEIVNTDTNQSIRIDGSGLKHARMSIIRDN